MLECGGLLWGVQGTDRTYTGSSPECIARARQDVNVSMRRGESGPNRVPNNGISVYRDAIYIQKIKSSFFAMLHSVHRSEIKGTTHAVTG